MPKRVEVGRDTPGAHPESSPDSALQRNTTEVRRLHNAVARMGERLDVCIQELRDQTDRLAREGEKVEDRYAAMEQLTERVGQLEAQVTGLTDALLHVLAQLETHTEAMRENTEAVRKASRY